ncbi:MAG: acyl-[ACP]--phospholipid O-acyltransferase [Alphaproteobacteria bacterium]|nr:acyl-[ACP]--phospholipid O-acyltransferase [Alphaproteobacteria bacterium]
MTQTQFSLLRDRRFGPLFFTQFLGAFHDNLFKNALVVLLVFTGAMNSDADPKILATLAAGLFILPFVLFSALGGQLADKYPKDRIIRFIKLAEIGIALLGAVAIISGSVFLSFCTLFALGAQSAFFGPSKYSILPQHLTKDELIGGNALLNVGTYLAILAGTILGAAANVLPEILIAAFLVVIAVTGYVASRFIPSAKAPAPELKINYNIFAETLRILEFSLSQKRGVYLAILGVAWFYFLGGMFMAQIPNFTAETLGAGPSVLVLLLVLFSVGVGIGGLLNNRLLHGRIEALYVPLAAIFISLFSVDLFFASGDVVKGEELTGLIGFLAHPAHWRILVDLFVVALAGGLYVVPLNAIIQHFTNEESRARVIAGSAILNAGFITASAILSAILIGLGWAIEELFLFFAVANGLVAVYIARLLPDYLFKSVLKGLLKLVYKVEVRGIENFEKAGERVVIVSNHVSLLDPPLLAAFLPGRPMFAVNTHVANWWWVKPFLRLVDAFPVDPTNPFSTKSLIREVEKGKQCVIFPEGRLSETGALMKVYEGPGMIADKAGATILPVRLDGVQHTPFARLKGKVPLHNFPRITITILPPREFRLNSDVKGRKRRALAGRQLYDLMEDMMYLTGDREQTLFQALLKAQHVNGAKAIIVEDIERKPMPFKKLLQGALVLDRHFRTFTERGENVGVLLPNSAGAVVTFFALQAGGRVPAMLNFSAGPKTVCSACQTAVVKQVITSRRFISMARLEPLIEEIEKVANIVYLEDVKKKIGVSGKIYGLLAPAFARSIHKESGVNPDAPAAVLFTSGSEGAPKGVVLSHRNFMTNIVQLSSRVDFNRQDIVFNCLPMFHSFGLTGGTLLPVLSGVKTFLYPNPLHYRIVPELVYSSNATIMFGTDTFLRGYARMSDPYDFYRMRYIFAGAEKVKDETRELYATRFGVRILEGYGATETAPVIAVNSPQHTKGGTVGRFLPGLETRLESVPGVDGGGRLYVRGDNVMLGYYLADEPGKLQPPAEGWHDTGDIVSLDEEGFVAIRGRAKRFAKIAGEMVSLVTVESMADKVWPDASHAVVAIPDEKKGEQLALVTTRKGAKREELSAYASANGITELAVPKTIMEVNEIPVLGTGKADYPAVLRMVEKR